MENINEVKISGCIHDIRHSEHGTYFVILRQNVFYNGQERMRLFEIVISPDHQEIIDKLSLNINVVFTGEVTIFNLRKFNQHKQMVSAKKMEIIA